MFPQLEPLSGYALVFLRVMAGIVFIDSGYNDVRDPAKRGQSIGLPTAAAFALGVAELAGGIAIIVGVLTQLAAIGLILIMLGALQKKIFVWKTGFWGTNGYGWSYELMLVSMLLVILCTNGGPFIIY